MCHRIAPERDGDMSLSKKIVRLQKHTKFTAYSICISYRNDACLRKCYARAVARMQAIPAFIGSLCSIRGAWVPQTPPLLPSPLRSEQSRAEQCEVCGIEPPHHAGGTLHSCYGAAPLPLTILSPLCFPSLPFPSTSHLSSFTSCARGRHRPARRKCVRRSRP